VTTDFVAISPKRWSIQNKYTVELLAESSPDVENMLARDRAKVQALAIDLAALNGPTGGASPVGILQTSGLATIASSGAALTTGKALQYSDWLAFEETLAIANADTASSGFMVTPETRAQAKGTPMFPNGYAMPIWASNQRDPDGLETGPLGYKAGVTNQVPKNLGANSNLHAAVFGDWSQLIVADYGASELIFDPYTGAGAGIYVVTERVLMDVEIRHISAFVACETIAVV
jgi:HK97 family phage major capsid protein